VLLLLDLDGRAILEGPFDDVSLVGCAFDELALLESRPELAEVLELDQVPNIAERRLDDGRLADGGGSGNTARHYVLNVQLILWRVFWWALRRFRANIGYGGVVLEVWWGMFVFL
jgi:hypothetical protein